MKIPAGESLILDKDLTLTELLEIEGTLILDPVRNVTISLSKNLIITGKLISKPDPSVVHTIRFVGINENNYQGGGDAVLSTDIGQWVTGSGQLDLQGAVVNDWKRLGTDYAAMEKFAQAVGSNLQIEGTATGHAHMFIKSTQPQFIRNVAFRYMGPRKDISGDGIKEFVTGRYAVHFHHCGDGSRGSIVEGCIARDCNSHCFVPHGSHGITMRGNIVHNVLEPPFWYDMGHKTNDITWDNNLVVKVGFIPRAQDDGAPQGGAGGFVLGYGDGNICRGNVVIGTSGDPRAAGAYIWPEFRDDNDKAKPIEGSWLFENNTSVNCPSGEQVWQNSDVHHIIRNSIHINCQFPLFHGAYVNDYNRIGGYYKGGIVDIRAASATTNRLRFEGITFDANGGEYCVQINEGPGNGAAPILFLNCKFINFTKKAIINQNEGPGLKLVDVVNCGLTPDQVQVNSFARAGEYIRLQQGDKAWKVSFSGRSSIAKFAPSLYGTGTGLQAQYYTPDFKTLLLARVDPNVFLPNLTYPSPHYAVPAYFAARWTGKIQPQFTSSYKFYALAGGGMRLWVNGNLLIDKWNERYPSEVVTNTISLTASKLYDIKLEFFNTDDRSGCTLEWECGALKREYIPMSQLYPGDITPPVNQKPTADAGADQLIGIAFYLTGKGTDTDGTIVGYKWEQVSGPLSVIVTAADRNTLVNPSGKGEYVFRLTVTDDKGSTGADEVRVTVG
jgi:hypothetical protein